MDLCLHIGYFVFTVSLQWIWFTNKMWVHWCILDHCYLVGIFVFAWNQISVEVAFVLLYKENNQTWFWLCHQRFAVRVPSADHLRLEFVYSYFFTFKHTIICAMVREKVASFLLFSSTLLESIHETKQLTRQASLGLVFREWLKIKQGQKK